MSQDYDRNAEDFFRKLNRQVREDHAGIRDRNAKREAVWRQSPAMRMASNLLQGPFGHEPVGEEEHAVMLLRAREAYMREPLVRRYMNHLEHSHRPHSNTEWWHALGHQYIVAAQFTQANTFDEAVRNYQSQTPSIPIMLDGRLFRPGGLVPEIGPREFSYEWMGRVMRSMTYLWHQNTYDAAVAAPLVPHVFQPNALPFDDLFFSFENAAFVSPTDSAMATDLDGGTLIPTISETWWIQISRLADAGVALVFDRYLVPRVSDYVHQSHIMFEPIPYGARWPEDFEGYDSHVIVGAVLRMLAFMQAPFVDATTSARELPRDIRKEYKREGKQAPLKEVSVITLRARLYEPTFVPNGEVTNGSGRVYQHSWWVNGHYRWQWFPSTKEHKLIAIAPYMKQVGKPLLPQIRDVSR